NRGASCTASIRGRGSWAAASHTRCTASNTSRQRQVADPTTSAARDRPRSSCSRCLLPRLRRHVGWRLERLDISDELPHCVGCEQQSAVGRHAVRAAIIDRLEQRAVRAAEPPPALRQSRPHPPGAIWARPPPARPRPAPPPAPPAPAGVRHHENPTTAAPANAPPNPPFTLPTLGTGPPPRAPTIPPTGAPPPGRRDPP